MGWAGGKVAADNAKLNDGDLSARRPSMDEKAS